MVGAFWQFLLFCFSLCLCMPLFIGPQEYQYTAAANRPSPAAEAAIMSSHGYGGSRRRGYSHGYGGSRRRGNGNQYGLPYESMATYSRKRRASGYGGSRRRWSPGYSRTSGFYGRYPNIGGELKFHDGGIEDGVVAAAGTITPSVNLIAQGITESTRNGRKCTITNINWRYQCDLLEIDAAATPASGDTVRVILYVDHQCNGAAAAVTDILETASYQSFRNLANTQRFSFLLDRTHTLNYSGLASDGAGVVSQASVERNYTFFKKVNIPLEFNSTVGVITEIRSENIGLLLISHNGVASFESDIRLRFSDASQAC